MTRAGQQGKKGDEEQEAHHYFSHPSLLSILSDKKNETKLRVIGNLSHFISWGNMQINCMIVTRLGLNYSPRSKVTGSVFPFSAAAKRALVAVVKLVDV